LLLHEQRRDMVPADPDIIELLFDATSRPSHFRRPSLHLVHQRGDSLDPDRPVPHPSGDLFLDLLTRRSVRMIRRPAPIEGQRSGFCPDLDDELRHVSRRSVRAAIPPGTLRYESEDEGPTRLLGLVDAHPILPLLGDLLVHLGSPPSRIGRPTPCSLHSHYS